MNTSSLTGAGFDPATIVWSNADRTAAFAEFRGMPYQIDSVATPEYWAMLQEAIENGNVTVADYLPPPPASHEAVCTAVWERIKTERDTRKVGGGVQVGGYWFKTDESSRSDYLSLITLANLSGHTATDVIRPAWRTMVTGVDVDMTMSLAGGIIAAGAQRWFLIDNVAQAHKAAMLASADPTSYDYSTGWPQTFAEWQAAQTVVSQGAST